MGDVNVVVLEDVVEVPFHEVVPELVSDAEVLEPLARDVGRIHDPEIVAVPEQHAGDAAGGIRLGLHFDVVAGSDRERIDRERGNPLVAEELLSALLGYL